MPERRDTPRAGRPADIGKGVVPEYIPGEEDSRPIYIDPRRPITGADQPNPRRPRVESVQGLSDYLYTKIKENVVPLRDEVATLRQRLELARTNDANATSDVLQRLARLEVNAGVTKAPDDYATIKSAQAVISSDVTDLKGSRSSMRAWFAGNVLALLGLVAYGASWKRDVERSVEDLDEATVRLDRYTDVLNTKLQELGRFFEGRAVWGAGVDAEIKRLEAEIDELGTAPRRKGKPR